MTNSSLSILCSTLIGLTTDSETSASSFAILNALEAQGLVESEETSRCVCVWTATVEGITASHG